MIDRLFRFLEMITVVGVLGFAFEVVAPGSKFWITMILGTLAGVYIALPFTRWLDLVFAARRGIRNAGFATTVLAFAMCATGYSLVVIVVLQSTIQVDEARARRDFNRLFAPPSCLTDVQNPCPPPAP